ncbi:glycine cleavage system protein GcvH [Streptomyces actinomycinicus]|uniref:Glycine cleavage system H protein n=1 Tax=Streptomyces actinomycinicus TaxID=1695166 RepID=A0A937EE62_9ACTN|nr:glycine cleavage system protein GcvH [Streptomyces actinomycinicus]MBL1080474.1 glycine cleavage system protein GcvH [Streptomyces actinomycinicus]
MANIPENLQYTREHEWLMPQSPTARVGITDFAQRQLGDIVFVELPRPGDRFEAGEPFGTVESVKSVTELYLPVAGTVTEVNTALNDSPEDCNTDPYGDGWLIEIQPSAPAELKNLLTPKQYQDYIAEESG